MKYHCIERKKYTSFFRPHAFAFPWFPRVVANSPDGTCELCLLTPSTGRDTDFRDILGETKFTYLDFHDLQQYLLNEVLSSFDNKM